MATAPPETADYTGHRSERAVLVSRHAGDGHGGAEQLLSGMPVYFAARLDGREKFARYVELVQQFFIPAALANIEEAVFEKSAQ